MAEEQNQEQQTTTTEYESAKRDFAPLIEWVNAQYSAEGSSLKTEEQRESYRRHNDEILRFATELGLKEDFTKEELRTLQAAAILHDSQKARRNPNEAGSLPYVLVAHGAMAADGVDEEGWAMTPGEKGKGGVDDVFEKHPEMLKVILGQNYSEEDGVRVKEQIKTSIRAHMGPRPGFMQDVQTFVNDNLGAAGFANRVVGHPFPEDNISKTLLTADMGSLCTAEGRQKVLAIRANDERFKKEDKETVSRYAQLGVTLEMGEAAILSGHTSALAAANMLPEASAKSWAIGLIENSKGASYIYGNATVSYENALSKQADYSRREKARDIALPIIKKYGSETGLSAEVENKINSALKKAGLSGGIDNIFGPRGLENILPEAPSPDGDSTL